MREIWTKRDFFGMKINDYLGDLPDTTTNMNLRRRHAASHASDVIHQDACAEGERIWHVAQLWHNIAFEQFASGINYRATTVSFALTLPQFSSVFIFASRLG